MRLWLDDERPLPVNFDVHVRSAFDAINLLSTGLFTAVSLDHDLGEGRGSGADVAKWVAWAAHNEQLGRVAWSCHSANTPGRDNIVSLMISAEQAWDQQDARKA